MLSKTKARSLSSSHLPLDFVLLREEEDDNFFPFLPLFILPPLHFSLHLNTAGD